MRKYEYNTDDETASVESGCDGGVCDGSQVQNVRKYTYECQTIDEIHDSTVTDKRKEKLRKEMLLERSRLLKIIKSSI